jgi:hypothetical protein
LDRWEQAHLLDHIDGDPAQVDRVAAEAQLRRTFHHDRANARASEPPRERRTCDSGS